MLRKGVMARDIAAITAVDEENSVSSLCRSEHKPQIAAPLSHWKMERETGIEPATSSLGSWRSTAELLPLTSKAQRLIVIRAT